MEFIKIKKVKMVTDGTLRVEGGLKKLSSPKDAAKVLQMYLKDEDREVMACMCLNTKNAIVNISTISIGSLNSSIVHPREVFKIALLSNSASIIVGHNHPSGDTTPSKEDINITHRLKECGKILGVELLDHIIIGDNYTSLKEKGIL